MFYDISATNTQILDFTVAPKNTLKHPGQTQKNQQEQDTMYNDMRAAWYGIFLGWKEA